MIYIEVLFLLFYEMFFNFQIISVLLTESKTLADVAELDPC